MEEGLVALSSSSSIITTTTTTTSNKKRKKVGTLEVDPSSPSSTLETAKQELIVAEKRVKDLKCLIERLEENENKNKEEGELKKEETNNDNFGNQEDEEDDVNANTMMLLLIYKVLPNVLEWLDPTDVLTCVKVCKQFQYDIDGNSNIWKQSISTLTPSLIETIEKRRNNIMKLTTTKKKKENNKNKNKNDKSSNNNNNNKASLKLTNNANKEEEEEEEEAESQNPKIDYKMIAKRLVYKPLLLPSQQHLHHQQQLISSSSLMLKPKDIIVIVEGRMKSTGMLIGCWQQDFSKYKYMQREENIMLRRHFPGRRERKFGIDMFNNNNNGIINDCSTHNNNNDVERKKKVILPLGLLEEEEEEDDDDDSLSGDDDDDDEDHDNNNNNNFNYAGPPHSANDTPLKIKNDIGFTIRLFRCDNNQSTCFTFGPHTRITFAHRSMNDCKYKSNIQRPDLCKANEHSNIGMYCEIHTNIDPIIILNNNIPTKSDNDDDDDSNNNNNNKKKKKKKKKQRKYYCMTKLSLTFDVQVQEENQMVRRVLPEIPYGDWNDLYRSFDNLSWK